MSTDIVISLDDQLATFVDRQVAEGRYHSASDVVRAALQLLEEQQAKLVVLRLALVEGEGSGPSEPFDFERFLEENGAA